MLHRNDRLPLSSLQPKVFATPLALNVGIGVSLSSTICTRGSSLVWVNEEAQLGTLEQG